MVIPFGKHKGKEIGTVPSDYLEWVLREKAGDYVDGFLAAVQKELNRRKAEEASFRGWEASKEDEEPKPKNWWEWQYDWADERTPPYTNRPASDPYGSATHSNTRSHSERAGQCTTCGGFGMYRGTYCSCTAGVTKRLESVQQLLKQREAEAARLNAEVKELRRKNASSGLNGSPSASHVRSGQEVNTSDCKEVIAAGRKALARKYHPDTGGDVKRMQALNSCADWLEKCADTLPR